MYGVVPNPPCVAIHQPGKSLSWFAENMMAGEGMQEVLCQHAHTSLRLLTCFLHADAESCCCWPGNVCMVCDRNREREHGTGSQPRHSLRIFNEAKMIIFACLTVFVEIASSTTRYHQVPAGTVKYYLLCIVLHK